MPQKKQKLEDGEIDEGDEIEGDDVPPEASPKGKKPRSEPLFPPQPKPRERTEPPDPFNSLGTALQPVIEQINNLDAKLEKFMNPPAPPEPPKPKSRGYRLFDEFDPTLEGEA